MNSFLQEINHRDHQRDQEYRLHKKFTQMLHEAWDKGYKNSSLVLIVGRREISILDRSGLFRGLRQVGRFEFKLNELDILFIDTEDYHFDLLVRTGFAQYVDSPEYDPKRKEFIDTPVYREEIPRSRHRPKDRWV